MRIVVIAEETLRGRRFRAPSPELEMASIYRAPPKHPFLLFLFLRLIVVLFYASRFTKSITLYSQAPETSNPSTQLGSGRDGEKREGLKGSGFRPVSPFPSHLASQWQWEVIGFEMPEERGRKTLYRPYTTVQ